MQANITCTSTRTKKVVIGLTLVSMTVGIATSHVYDNMHVYDKLQLAIAAYLFNAIVFATYMVLPVTVLVINVVLIREVRRAASYTAANLGLQQHHQSTSSNSAVPTVMLITTSLVYVLLRGSVSLMSIPLLIDTSVFMLHCYIIVVTLSTLTFAYNFYVYLITGKQFRSELRKLFCRTSSSAAAAVTYSRNDTRLSEYGRADTAV